LHKWNLSYWKKTWEIGIFQQTTSRTPEWKSIQVHCFF